MRLLHWWLGKWYRLEIVTGLGLRNRRFVLSHNLGHWDLRSSLSNSRVMPGSVSGVSWNFNEVYIWATYSLLNLCHDDISLCIWSDEWKQNYTVDVENLRIGVGFSYLLILVAFEKSQGNNKTTSLLLVQWHAIVFEFGKCDILMNRPLASGIWAAMSLLVCGWKWYRQVCPSLHIKTQHLVIISKTNILHLCPMNHRVIDNLTILKTNRNDGLGPRRTSGWLLACMFNKNQYWNFHIEVPRH